MTEEEAIALRVRVATAINAAEEALAVALKAVPPAPVETLRVALVELTGARAACDLCLEQKHEEAMVPEPYPVSPRRFVE